MAKLIGITGGIASGKSTVTTFLRENGYVVIDADALVHTLQEPGGELYRVLLEYFGETILQKDGRLDRRKLGELIFQDETTLTWSKKAQGDIIRHALSQARDQALEQHTIVFMDIPLLIEQGYQEWFDAIWLVTVSPDIQKQRLIKRNHLSEEQAMARLRSQMPLSDKADYADLVIDNNGHLEATKKQVAHALEQLNLK